MRTALHICGMGCSVPLSFAVEGISAVVAPAGEESVVVADYVG